MIKMSYDNLKVIWFDFSSKCIYMILSGEVYFFVEVWQCGKCDTNYALSAQDRIKLKKLYECQILL